MIENLSIDKIKEMIWEEVFLKHLDDIHGPGEYAWLFADYLADFIRYHRRCIKGRGDTYYVECIDSNGKSYGPTTIGK